MKKYTENPNLDVLNNSNGRFIMTAQCKFSDSKKNRFIYEKGGRRFWGDYLKLLKGSLDDFGKIRDI